MKFGERLRELRKEQHISQRALAERVNVDFTYLSKIENGQAEPPSMALIYRLQETLEVDEDELVYLACKIPENLSATLQDNPSLVQLIYVLAEHRLSEDMYRKIMQTMMSD